MRSKTSKKRAENILGTNFGRQNEIHQLGLIDYFIYPLSQLISTHYYYSTYLLRYTEQSAGSKSIYTSIFKTHKTGKCRQQHSNLVQQKRRKYLVVASKLYAH